MKFMMNGYPAHKRSLVDDAKFESTLNKVQKDSLLREVSVDSEDAAPSEEEFLLVHSVGRDSEEQCMASLLLTLSGGLTYLTRILKTVENCRGTILHVETRCSDARLQNFGEANGIDKKDFENLKEMKIAMMNSNEVLIKITIDKESLISLLKSLRQGTTTKCVKLLPSEELHTSVQTFSWFPRHVSQLDHCNHLMTKYEPDLDLNHPGFSDAVYRERRKSIAQIAFNYRHGEPIPRVNYSEMEESTWGKVFEELDKLVPTHACYQYRLVWETLKKELNYNSKSIPQLQDVSDFMQRRTGFTLRPAAGLLTARDFLASLAFRVFQCTQYVRHHSSPHHSPEPDAIHELLGHAPLLADPQFAQFSQDLGLASLGATDQEIEMFATMYWFTVEFGLCKEGPKKEIKAWGAGLLSSYGEMEHALSNAPQQLEFDPSVTSVQTYQDQDYQDVYFVAENISDAQQKFRRWAATTLSRPYQVRYDPFSQSVEVLNTHQSLTKATRTLLSDLSNLTTAMEKLKD